MSIATIAKDLEGFSHIECTDAMLCLEKAHKNWDKQFSLKPLDGQCNWTLPNKDSINQQHIWKDDILQELKTTLNNHKAKLETMSIHDWNKHTYTNNPAFRIKTVFRKNADPEFMTTAFLKLYELLSRFNVLPEKSDDPAFVSMHLCEAPGAFVTALNHYLCLNRTDLREKWRWVGHSLNPYYEGSSDFKCINDDQFIMHTVQNWFFGDDSTGDIICSKFLLELQRSSYRRKVHFVTADGSIDCQYEPGEQEAITHRLHLAELIAAFLILKQGGCLVMKMFTFFECETINLLYLLCCSFEYVQVVKPITSKWGNSEVYILAQGFQVSSVEDILPQLIELIDDLPSPKCSIIPKYYMTSEFLANIQKCSGFFASHQQTAISSNLKLYHKNSKDLELNSYLKTCVLRKFINNTNVLKIDSRLKLVKGFVSPCQILNPVKGVIPTCVALRKYNRCEQARLLREKIEYLQKILSPTFAKLKTASCKDINVDTIENVHEVMYGKSFESVSISRFCPKMAMSVFNFFFYLQSNMDKKFSEKWNASQKEKIDLSVNTVKCMYNKTVIFIRQMREPTGFCDSLDDAFLKLESNELKENDDMCIVNTELFTRLQVGMFIVIASCFKNIQVEIPSDVHGSYIIFRNYHGKGDESIKKLKSAGWIPGGSKTGLLQIIPIKNILSHQLYETICTYNYYYCLTNSIVLQNILESMLEIVN